MLAYQMVFTLDGGIRIRIRICILHNLTPALGYVSHTNHITVMRFAFTNQSVTVLSLMPITS